MSFLYPAYLYGLLLVSIPIIIHFFNFQRARRVYFTNVDFLKTVKEVTNARSKIKNILVLIARILFLAFLILAFARPFIPKDNSNALGEGNYVSVYIDNSFSMQNEQDNRRLFDIALRQAEEITNIFPANTLYQLVTNNSLENYQFFYDKSRFLEKITEIDFSNSDLQWEGVANIQKQAFAQNSTGQGNHIFWVSDYQKYAEESLNSQMIDTVNNYYLLPLRATNKANLYVDSVWLESPFIQLQENNEIKIKLRNDSEESLYDQVVKLYIDDKQVASTTVEIDPISSKEVILSFAVTESGSKPCRITLDDYPIIFDNEYYFTLQVAPKIKIIQVAGGATQYMERVYENEPFFDFEKYSINDLDYNALQSADLIILDNLATLDNALQTALRNATAKGVSVAVFPSIGADVSSYSSALVLPFRNSGIQNFNERAFVEVEVPEPGNPFFEGVFEKVVKNMSMPKGIALYNWNNTGEHLLSYKNGRPFLSVFKNDTHNVYLFSSPLNEATSTFFKHALFVPVMYKIALGSKVNTGNLAFSFSDELASIKVNDFTRNDIVKFRLDQLEFIPDQRMVGNELLVSVPENEATAGNYQMIKNRTHEMIGHISFNYDKSESNLRFFSEDELQTFAERNARVQLFENRDEENFAKEFKEQQFSKALWRYALFLALLFLLAETLLVRFWKVD